MGIHAKKPEGRKQARKNGKKKSGWACFYRVVKILDSRWFAAVLAIAWSAAAYGKERK